jgi:Ti-type conjugative transfer relaxase TraA
MGSQGLESERLAEHHDIARANGEKLLAHPALALDAITRQQATFTTRDLAMFVHRHSDGKEQFDQVMAAVKAAPELVALGRDGRGEDRFTSRDMIETEQRLERATTALAERGHHGVADRHREAALAHAAEHGMMLSPEQRGALDHVTNEKNLGVVIGYAGTGKSAMLGVAREAWEAAGYHVHGLALSGIAAENLESGSGIASRTIASIEHQWGQGRELLDRSSVLVIDEAGMIGTRQMERVITEAEKRGAKVVLVGDPQQLQAIEAGAAFRSIAERHGGIEVTQIRRQREDWQRDATRHLATGRTGEAVRAYEQAGHVHAADTNEQARDNLIDRWDKDRIAAPGASRIILTHTNDAVRDLNLAARERLRAAGELGEDVSISAERGNRSFASGDRIMFLKNERGLGVKNGSLGTVQSLTVSRMAVTLDDGRSIAFDTKDYAHVDHGYAATTHKAQGMTVDRVHVLATPGLDSHATYVALSRHRDSVDLHYGNDDFADQTRLVRALSRERGKDMASDYALKPKKAPDAPQQKKSPFDGLKLRPVEPVERQTSPSPDRVPVPAAEDREAQLRRMRTNALIRHARAVDVIFDGHFDGRRASPEQLTELADTRRAFDDVRPHGWRDAEKAYSKDPSLVKEAANGQVNRAIRALQLETELRTNPQLRADRFVARWNDLGSLSQRQYVSGHMTEYHSTRSAMGDMAKSLERDPQLESILASRKQQLGIMFETGRSLGAELAFSHGIDLGRGRGLGL